MYPVNETTTMECVISEIAHFTGGLKYVARLNVDNGRLVLKGEVAASQKEAWESLQEFALTFGLDI